jgi:hypothetical protein
MSRPQSCFDSTIFYVPSPHGTLRKWRHRNSIVPSLADCRHGGLVRLHSFKNVAVNRIAQIDRIKKQVAGVLDASRQATA